MAEKEYIERDSIYSRVKRHTNPYGKPTIDYESGVKVLDMIKQEPAADVAPVVHGEWKLHGNDDDLGSTYWCSHCYFQVDEELFYPHGYDEEKPYNYCPRCGAKMDGATDNNVGGKRKE